MQLKQSGLAQMIGVSQVAVARWESGQDLPSRERYEQIVDLFRNSSHSALQIEQLFIERQLGSSALFDLDGIRLRASSQGYKKIWPKFSLLTDHMLADHLMETAADIMRDASLMQAIEEGSVALITGVSHRHTDFTDDPATHHRWHIQFRTQGPLKLFNLVIEPCDSSTPPGIEECLNTDALAYNQF